MSEDQIEFGEVTTYALYPTLASPVPMVTIHFDGTIEFGPDYDPDEASRMFWAYIGRPQPDLTELRDAWLAFDATDDEPTMFALVAAAGRVAHRLVSQEGDQG